jgi:phosphoribosylanthranilate isomerase
MKDKDNILDVAGYQPDYMGFLFYKDSPRFVGAHFQIPNELDPSIKRVGVFVNESSDRILGLSSQHRFDYIQLHGDETPDQCRFLKEKELGLIKVFGVDNKFDFECVKPFEPYVNFFLFDYKGALRGGNGVPFDWQVLQQFKSSIPFFLSGGINADNIEGIHGLTHPNLHAIDVNSGVEDSYGIKNKYKLEELLSKLKKTAK